MGVVGHEPYSLKLIRLSEWRPILPPGRYSRTPHHPIGDSQSALISILFIRIGTASDHTTEAKPILSRLRRTGGWHALCRSFPNVPEIEHGTTSPPGGEHAAEQAQDHIPTTLPPTPHSEV